MTFNPTGGIAELAQGQEDTAPTQGIKGKITEKLANVLAAQKANELKAAALTQIQSEMEVNPQTIAEQEDQKLYGSTYDEVKKQVVGVMDKKNRDAKARLNKATKPKNPSVGIAQRMPTPAPQAQGLANARMVQAAAQGGPPRRMASGGIVGFANGGRAELIKAELDRLGLTKDAFLRKTPEVQQQIIQTITDKANIKSGAGALVAPVTDAYKGAANTAIGGGNIWGGIKDNRFGRALNLSDATDKPFVPSEYYEFNKTRPFPYLTAIDRETFVPPSVNELIAAASQGGEYNLSEPQAFRDPTGAKPRDGVVPTSGTHTALKPMSFIEGTSRKFPAEGGILGSLPTPGPIDEDKYGRTREQQLSQALPLDAGVFTPERGSGDLKVIAADLRGTTDATGIASGGGANATGAGAGIGSLESYTERASQLLGQDEFKAQFDALNARLKELDDVQSTPEERKSDQLSAILEGGAHKTSPGAVGAGMSSSYRAEVNKQKRQVRGQLIDQIRLEKDNLALDSNLRAASVNVGMSLMKEDRAVQASAARAAAALTEAQIASMFKTEELRLLEERDKNTDAYREGTLAIQKMAAETAQLRENRLEAEQRNASQIQLMNIDREILAANLLAAKTLTDKRGTLAAKIAEGRIKSIDKGIEAHYIELAALNAQRGEAADIKEVELAIEDLLKARDSAYNAADLQASMSLEKQKINIRGQEIDYNEAIEWYTKEALRVQLRIDSARAQLGGGAGDQLGGGAGDQLGDNSISSTNVVGP